MPWLIELPYHDAHIVAFARQSCPPQILIIGFELVAGFDFGHHIPGFDGLSAVQRGLSIGEHFHIDIGVTVIPDHYIHIARVPYRGSAHLMMRAVVDAGQ